VSNILEKIELMSAEDLLDTYNIKTYPEVDTVDISDLYDKLGIKTYLKNFSDFESETGYKNVKGVVLSDKENVAIFISKKLSKNERRYMIAHLLGHCCSIDFNEYNIRHVETNDDCDIVHKNAENSNSQATWRDTDRGSLFLLLFDEGEERKGSRGDTGELGMGLTQN